MICDLWECSISKGLIELVMRRLNCSPLGLVSLVFNDENIADVGSDTTKLCCLNFNNVYCATTTKYTDEHDSQLLRSRV